MRGSNTFLFINSYTQHVKGMKTQPPHEKAKEKCAKRDKKNDEVKICVTQIYTRGKNRIVKKKKNKPNETN